MRDEKPWGSIFLGLSRNPFYENQDFFKNSTVNLGSIAKQVGEGGGRREAASTKIESASFSKIMQEILMSIQAEVERQM